MGTEEDYRCKAHDERIAKLENTVTAIIDNQNKMITEQALTNVKLDTISRQLENGIKSKLVVMEANMARILPVIENKIDLDKVIRNSILVLAVGGAASLFMFVLKLYFK